MSINIESARKTETSLNPHSFIPVENPEPYPCFVEKREEEAFVAIQAENIEREKEPSTSKLPRPHPAGFDYDDLGYPILDGKSMKFLSQKPGAQRSRQYKALPTRKGCSGSVLSHNGYSLKELSQTSNAKRLRRLREKGDNKTVSAKPENHPLSVAKRVGEALAAVKAKNEARAAIQAENIEREEEPSTSELPPPRFADVDYDDFGYPILDGELPPPRFADLDYDDFGLPHP